MGCLGIMDRHRRRLRRLIHDDPCTRSTRYVNIIRMVVGVIVVVGGSSGGVMMMMMLQFMMCQCTTLFDPLHDIGGGKGDGRRQGQIHQLQLFVRVGNGSGHRRGGGGGGGSFGIVRKRVTWSCRGCAGDGISSRCGGGGGVSRRCILIPGPLALFKDRIPCHMIQELLFLYRRFNVLQIKGRASLHRDGVWNLFYNRS